MALAKVAPDRHHLVDPEGNPFFALGINYAGYFDRGWKMWESDLFDAELIAQDFGKAQKSGFNCVRLFIHPALDREVRRSEFGKLDQVLSLAQDHNLMVMLTLNDSHFLDLSRVAEVDTKIAERYKDRATLIAYDLENEPVFYNLVAGIYPAEYQPPVQTSRLIHHYGVRVSRQEALELQQSRRIPGHLNADQAFYYINALRLFLEYDQAVSTFINQGKGQSMVDFLLSAEAEPWYTLIEVFDGTIDVWLRARIDPIRAAGCQQLLTVGWSWMHFASLPASRMLDFQQYHNYAGLTLAGFNTNAAHLQGLRRAFPDHPIVFGEFGWSNQTSSNPANSHAVSEELTALYEGASYAYLRANAFGGAFKWKLNDLDIAYNPYESSFGVFKVGNVAKPIRDVLLHFGENWPSVDQPATFTAIRNLEAGMAYRFEVSEEITVGGSIYQDDQISWQANGDAAHCFMRRAGNELIIEAQGSGRLSIAPWQLLAGWEQNRETDLYRIFSDSLRTHQASFKPNENVVIDVGPGVKYAVTMGAEVPVTPPEDLPEPNPGEHVVLLGDADHYLQAALQYIRRFKPDFTFAPDEVAGRWAYVTVVATKTQVADEVLENFRSVGAVLVERVVDENVEQTKALLDSMATKGKRFLSAAAPPQEEPPTEPSPDQNELYVVQPGDTLSGIANKVYGNYRLWPVIFDANRDKISDPGLIRVGMELLIPPKP